MFSQQMWLGTLMVTLTVVFHTAVLIRLSMLLTTMGKKLEERRRLIKVLTLLITAILVIVLVHTIEVWSWAWLYYYLDEFANFERALYFSAVTATTLGYGDIVLSPQWQLLSTFEAMGGLILFGLTTAIMIALVQQTNEFTLGEDQ